MKIADLIQHRDGVELPASGEWLIAPGQMLVDPKRRHAGLAKLCFCTTSGMLAVSTSPPVVTFELELSSTAACPALTLAYVGELATADRYGRWRLRGTIVTDGSGPRPVELAAIYHGVYRQGDVPIAWLTISGAVSPPTSWYIRGWRNHSRPLVFHGDLNAHQHQRRDNLAARWGPREPGGR